MRTYVRMVVCVYLPRFELTAAAGGRSELAQQALAGRALAVAPARRLRASAWERSRGRPRPAGWPPAWRSGRRSRAARSSCSCRPTRCAVAELWEGSLAALESIGAAVEPARPGLAYFETDGLAGLHGTREETIAAARPGARAVRLASGARRRASARWRRPWRRARAGRCCSEGAQARRWLAGPPGRPAGLPGGDRGAACAARASRGAHAGRAREARARRAEPTASARPGALAHRLAGGEDSPLRSAPARGAAEGVDGGR